MDYHYTTPKGYEVSSYEPMTEAQLREWDEVMSGYDKWMDDRGIESEEDYQAWLEQEAEDRESDGYGWERRALAGVARSF